MRVNKLLLCIFFLFTINQRVLAYDPYQTHPFNTFFQKYYPPYPKGKFPPTCKINRIHLRHIQEGIGSINKYVYEFTEHQQRRFIVITKHKNSRQIKASIFADKQKKAILSNILVDETYWRNNAIIFWSYLNQDNKKDLILIFPIINSSNETYIITFLLSNNNGYSVTRLSSMGVSQSLFYDYNNDNKCEFLKLQAINVSELTNKQLPTYLVYNIVQFTSTSIKYNNALSRFFPRWIEFKQASLEELSKDQTGELSREMLDQYGHLPNDKEAQLPQYIKDKFWSVYLSSFENSDSIFKPDAKPVKDVILHLKKKK